MTYEVYLYVQRGLFERHKLVFALMLATKVLVRGRAGGRAGAGWVAGS